MITVRNNYVIVLAGNNCFHALATVETTCMIKISVLCDEKCRDRNSIKLITVMIPSFWILANIFIDSFYCRYLGIS